MNTYRKFFDKHKGPTVTAFKQYSRCTYEFDEENANSCTVPIPNGSTWDKYHETPLSIN